MIGQDWWIVERYGIIGDLNFFMKFFSCLWTGIEMFGLNFWKRENFEKVFLRGSDYYFIVVKMVTHVVNHLRSGWLYDTRISFEIKLILK